jgi:hypothetical protein
MDDFQLRLIRALERLAGRDGPVLGDRLEGVVDSLDSNAVVLESRLDSLIGRLDVLIAVLEEIRDGLPGGGPGSGGGPP